MSSAPRSTIPICISKIVEASPLENASAVSRSVVVDEKPYLSSGVLRLPSEGHQAVIEVR